MGTDCQLPQHSCSLFRQKDSISKPQSKNHSSGLNKFPPHFPDSTDWFRGEHMVMLVDSVNLRLKQSYSFTMDQKREGTGTSEAI